MMGTQRNAEHGVIQSSIALLQERFKQLQRVKEMREKRELLRMFSDYNNSTTTTTTTAATTTTVSSTSTTSTTTTTNNNINSNTSDSTMQYNYETCSHDCNTTSSDELQVFLPRNYYNYINNNHNNKPFTSSLAPHNNSHNLNEVSLSLWPPMSCNNVASAADQFLRPNIEAPISTTISILRPPAAKEMGLGRASCVSTALKLEDSHHHVPDVDTTLHL